MNITLYFFDVHSNDCNKAQSIFDILNHKIILPMKKT